MNNPEASEAVKGQSAAGDQSGETAEAQTAPELPTAQATVDTVTDAAPPTTPGIARKTPAPTEPEATATQTAPDGNRKLRRHIAVGGILCLCLALVLTVVYYLDAQPIQRLAQRYADTTSPVLYEFAFDSADSAGEYVRGKVVVSSSEFEYAGIDSLLNIGEFYRDIDAQKEQLNYSLERLPDNQQPEGAAEANRRDYCIFLLMPWTVYLVMTIGYQLICYRSTKKKTVR